MRPACAPTVSEPGSRWAWAGVLMGERNPTTGPTPEFAVGGKVGVNFYAERFEVFVHVTPITRVYPNLEPFIGGGFGLRYDLYRP